MGNGKRRKWEMPGEADDEKISIITACPLRIQQQLLERTSATGNSGEEVETIAYASA